MRKIQHVSQDSAALSEVQLEEVRRAARALSLDKRQEILMAFPETHLHPHLKSLFEALDSEYLVEVTHGTGELGKDLVLVKRNDLTTDVIGVVVKCGDITGKTLGAVDDIEEKVQKLSAASEKKVREVESQIKQALVHPAEMHSILQALPVNKIMVVLAGKLSGNARTRIENELNLGDKVRDIEWLVEQFTLHYPQVFFEGKCVDFLQNEIQRLETGDWLAEGGKNLSEWWVEPAVTSAEVPVNFDTETLETIWLQERFPVAGLGKVLKEGRHIILAGDPGSGKSAAMAKFALNMLRAAYEKATRHPGDKGEKRQPLDVPILVTARQVWEAQSAASLRDEYFGGAEVAEQFHIQTLLVDGLDEIPSADRQPLIEKAAEFVESLGSSLVITSRRVEILRQTPKGFRKYELLPFEMRQAMQLFEKLLAGDPLLGPLREGLQKSRNHIPLTPLSLVLLMQVAKEHREVPSSLAELYDRFFDTVLGRFEAKRGIEVLFEPLIKRRFLSTLAYHEFFRKDRLEIPESDFHSFCQSYAREFDYDEQKLVSFTSEIDRAGILVMRDSVEFKHRSFLDYFTAQWLSDNPDEIEGLTGFLVETYFNDMWADITFFYVGLKRTVGQPLLQKIFDYPTDTLNSDASKLMSGRLLQAGWHSPGQVKKFGVQQAFRYAPRVRAKVLEVATRSKGRVPKIIADYIVMTVAEDSLRSGHLAVQLKELLAELLAEDTSLDVQMLPSVLWTVQSLLSEEELSVAVQSALEVIGRPSFGTLEESAAALVMMRNLRAPDKELMKSIDKHMRRLQRKNSEAFKAILPIARKGFRPQKAHKPPPQLEG